MNHEFIPSAHPPPANARPAWWFVFRAKEMIVTGDGETASVPLLGAPSALGVPIHREWYLGTLDGSPCYGADAEGSGPLPPGLVACGLRDLYGKIDDLFLKVAMRAFHLLEWDRTTGFCSSCGARTVRADAMNAKECPACGFLGFPRISPAIIVLVERDGRVLLARARRFAAPMYSVLAGFVEPGETLEETVAREIGEEVGIRVKNLRYFGSQPWPFPDSLMIGFTAEYAGGEIAIDEEELIDAGWYDPADLPAIPGKISIARQLIDWFVQGRGEEQVRRG
jgi:NAD+ diphosphatase